MSVQDIRGKIFDLAAAPQRIVSLVPSVTESLFAFGSGARVVGVTDYCIHPAEGVAAKTRIGGTKNPRVDQILGLAPDLVIANAEENMKRDVDALEAHGVPVFVMFPQTVCGAIHELRALAQLVGAQHTEEVIQPIESALATRPSSRKPRVFVAIWRNPWMTVNGATLISNLIETCGGVNVFRTRERLFPLSADLGRAAARAVAGQDTRYPRVALEEIVRNQPEIILLPDEPYRFTERDAKELRAAIPAARVHCVDGTLVSWHGIRLGRAIETLSTLIHGN